MRKYQKFSRDEWRNKCDDDAAFLWHFYEEFDFHTCRFTNCKWVHSKFYRSSFRESHFIDCTFDDCKFYGQHTYLGPAKFERCIFEKCLIKDVQPWKATFINTCFPRTQFENLSFYGVPDDWCTEFDNVDLTKTQFAMTGFNGVDLTTVKLPTRGIRVFQNANNEYRRALFAASGADASITDSQSRLKKCNRRALLILSDSAETVFDPVGYSEDFLVSILTDPGERADFEAIASEFEVTSRYI